MINISNSEEIKIRVCVTVTNFVYLRAVSYINVLRFFQQRTKFIQLFFPSRIFYLLQKRSTKARPFDLFTGNKFIYKKMRLFRQVQELAVFSRTGHLTFHYIMLFVVSLSSYVIWITYA